jgi:hypothetical protein
MIMVKSPNNRPNFDPFYEADTNPAPMKESYGNKKPVILWDPEQMDFGPVYHIRANFKDLDHPIWNGRRKCRGKACPVCKATRIYTQWLRENGHDLPERTEQ